MLRLGIIGLNEGNGHPFSYSAMFNGYDPVELNRRCPFPLIREYLPRDHRNEVFIESGKVTHVWTQDPHLSEDVARVSRIPNIVSHYSDLIGRVDAVILARDDPWNHLEMAEPFLKNRVPLFIDKQLAASRQDFERILSLTGPSYPLMAGSASRFTRDLARARSGHRLESVKTIHGVSRASWMRYGHHLFEGIACLWGLEIDWVRSLSEDPDHDILQIRYAAGPNVILEFSPRFQLPIQFTCFSEGDPAFSVPFQDFFHSYREMMRSFVDLVISGSRAIPYEQIVGIAKVILAGDISKKCGGRPVSPSSLAEI